MLATVEQIQRGAARYIDAEFTAKIPGWRKWAFGAGAALMIDNLGAVIDKYRADPLVSTMGVFNDGGGINVDVLYKYLKAEADKSAVTFDLPVIGATTLTSADVDKLYNCICQG